MIRAWVGDETDFFCFFFRSLRIESSAISVSSWRDVFEFSFRIRFGFVSELICSSVWQLFLSCLRSASSRQLWPSAEHRLTRASLRSCDKAEPRLGLHRFGSAELGSAATGTVEQRRRATSWAHATYATITPARRRPGETAIRREGAMPICLEKIVFSLSLFLQV